MGHDGSTLLASCLEDRRDSLIDASCRALVSAGNALVRRPEVLSQLRRHYAEILGDVTTSLRRGAADMDSSHSVLTHEIGTARASAGVEPGVSLQAATVFYDCVLGTAAEIVVDLDIDLRAFTLAALALQASITHRVHDAFASYTSFLLEKIHTAQTEERRRIARNLHDRIGHCLSVAHHQLELSETYRQTDGRKSAEKLAAAHQAVTDAMASLREVARGLHSSELRRGLRASLMDAAREIGDTRTDLRIQVNGDESWAQLRVLEECDLMIREAVRNALAHASPSTIAVNVDITPSEITAVIVDNGAGFDTRVARPGIGLSAMRERAELLGGDMAIHSGHSTGTRIRFVVPLSHEREAM